jgi:hypothetical protein
MDRFSCSLPIRREALLHEQPLDTERIPTWASMQNDAGYLRSAGDWLNPERAYKFLQSDGVLDR